MTLTPRLLARLRAMFAGADQAEAVALLEADAGRGLPYGETMDEAGVERIRAALLKLSKGSLAELRAAIAVAKVDWRDTLVGAGFGSSVTAHAEWLDDKEALRVQKVSTCLWFDTQAKEAALFYVGLFPGSKVLDIKVWPDMGEGEWPGRPGSVLTVRFTLAGTEYLALNGGPHYRHTPAMSMVAYCESQAEIDRLWDALGEGGKADQCGWLTDRYGVSWQVVPRMLMDLVNGRDAAGSRRVLAAMLGMVKLDMAALQKAYEGS